MSIDHDHWRKILIVIGDDVPSMYILSFLNRLYTGPKDDYVFSVLSKPVYKKVMENNVDLELSFNDWDVSKEKTLREPLSAYFSDTASSTIFGSKWACKVKINGAVLSAYINYVVFFSLRLHGKLHLQCIPL